MHKYFFIALMLTVAQATLAFAEITIQSGDLEAMDSGGYYYDGPLGDGPYSDWGDFGYIEWSGLASPVHYGAALGNYHNVIDRTDCYYGNYCNYEFMEEMGHFMATASFSLSSAAVLQVTQDGNLGLQITHAHTGIVWHDGVMDTLPPVINLAPGTWNFVVADINGGVSNNSSANWYDEETGSSDYSSSSSYDASGWVEITNTLLGDFNYDGAINNVDIDLLRIAINTSSADPIYDVNGGGLDGTDFNYQVLRIIGSVFGDADLNQQINFTDFVSLSTNFGSSGTGWGQGNFNLDDITNLADFVALANNYGADLSSRVSAQTTVSEPASLVLLSLAVGLVVRQRGGNGR